VTVEGISDGTAAFGAPTIYGHAAIEPPIVVGAVPWFDTPAFDTATVGTPLMDPEAFTSRGGMLPMHFDAPGAFSMSSTFKPDVAAVDGNNTTFFGNDLGPGAPFGENDGFPNFFGTSASAPNAAAVAALALELEPRLTPAEIKDLMRQTAVDVQGFRAAPGDDDVTGAGLVDGVTLLNAIAGTEREGGKQRPILIREIKEGRCYHEYLGAPDVELSDRTFVDFYSLDWPGGDLEISLSSEQADAYLVVFEPPGEPSGVRRDINEGTIGAEVYSAIDAPAGTYTIWANTFERQSGAYRLHVNCLEPISSTVKNPSLEDGDDGDWTVFSTRPSSSVCESSACGSAGGTAGPRSGDWWIWFGRLRVMGAPSVVERSRVEQEIRISRGTATLEFYLWLGAASGNGLDRLDASVDGSVVFSVLAGNAAFSAGYAPVRVDLSKFADGSNHRVRFEATLRPGAAATNISIDDVRLLVCGPPAAARHWSRYR
jgi:hypothetical protein